MIVRTESRRVAVATRLSHPSRGRTAQRMKIHSRLYPLFALLLASLAASQLPAQDWVHTGTNLGSDRIRIATADFKPVGGGPQTPALKAAFDSTLYSDLGNAGIFDLVSKSMAPQAAPGSPQE